MSCDRNDADPLRFWTTLVASIRLSEPSFGDDTLDRIELDGRVDLPAIGVLSDELRAITQPLVIIVDDIHDAAALLAALGAAVDREAVSLLARRTEGWAAGLQLAGLSVRDRDDASTYLLEVASTDRNLADYLTAEVLEQQPADVTDFLLAASVLRDLDARACRAITGHRDAHERLRDIEARGLFLVPLDHERRRYRYHHLFAQLLQAELRLRDEQRELELHETASEWYASAIDLLDDVTLGQERELALEFALTVGMNGALDEAGRWLRRLAHLDDMQADTTFRGRLAAAQAFWEMARGGAQRAMSHTIRARQLLEPTEDIARDLTVAESRGRYDLDDLDGVRRLAADGAGQGLPPMAAVVVTGALRVVAAGWTTRSRPSPEQSRSPSSSTHPLPSCRGSLRRALTSISSSARRSAHKHSLA
jgi:ATP/maltotriose-dependent transcriptional regulator MalT